MWNAFKRLITINPMGIFVYSLLTKWYLTIAVAGLIVTYWVFKGLQSAGVIDAAEKIVGQAIHDSKSVAKYCVPKITNLEDFWSCLNNLPAYVPEQDEVDLESKVDALKQNLQNRNANPEPANNADPYYDNGQN